MRPTHYLRKTSKTRIWIVELYESSGLGLTWNVQSKYFSNKRATDFAVLNDEWCMVSSDVTDVCIAAEHFFALANF